MKFLILAVYNESGFNLLRLEEAFRNNMRGFLVCPKKVISRRQLERLLT